MIRLWITWTVLLSLFALPSISMHDSTSHQNSYPSVVLSHPAPYALTDEAQPSAVPAHRFKEEPGLEFFGLGDWGCKMKNKKVDGNQRKVADSMFNSGFKPSFVLALGDNFYEHGVKSVKDERWGPVFEDLYVNTNVDVPWHAIVGNHDWRAGASGIQAQVDYSKQSKRWKMPYSYHRMVMDVTADVKALFIFLDTTKLIDGDAPQLDWFKDVLAKASEQYVVVVGHHPVISASDHGNLPTMMEQIYPLLNQYNVDLYIAGHDHVLEHLVHGTVHYFVCGSGCKVGTMKDPIPQLLYGEARLGFCRFRITPSEIAASIVGEGGKVIHEAAFPRQRN